MTTPTAQKILTDRIGRIEVSATMAVTQTEARSAIVIIDCVGSLIIVPGVTERVVILPLTGAVVVAIATSCWLRKGSCLSYRWNRSRRPRWLSATIILSWRSSRRL